jgi:hypothetical protein
MLAQRWVKKFCCIRIPEAAILSVAGSVTAAPAAAHVSTHQLGGTNHSKA